MNQNFKLLIISFLGFLFYFQLKINRNKSNLLEIIDFSKSLVPKQIYDQIVCRKSAEIYVKTTLCMHELKQDEVVSGAINAWGVWEGHIVTHFMDYLHKNPDWLVLDVGSQVGQYSLFAAKLGRDVVAVEPFIENILRFQKAVQAEKLENKIILIKNAISNKRGEIKRLRPVSVNIGGQSLLDYKDQVFKKEDMKNDKYLVETILFDDIIEVLPKRSDGTEYKKALLKLDIEGFEPYAFEHARKLFDRLDIQVLFMEWHFMNNNRDKYTPLIDNMINILTEKRLFPYFDKKRLNFNNRTSWPNDIYWIKE